MSLGDVLNVGEEFICCGRHQQDVGDLGQDEEWNKLPYLSDFANFIKATSLQEWMESVDKDESIPITRLLGAHADGIESGLSVILYTEDGDELGTEFIP